MSRKMNKERIEHQLRIMGLILDKALDSIDAEDYHDLGLCLGDLGRCSRETTRGLKEFLDNINHEDKEFEEFEEAEKF